MIRMVLGSDQPKDSNANSIGFADALIRRFG
jgi:hypothetical protein